MRTNWVTFEIIPGVQGLPCLVAAIIFVLGCGFAQADVYKWTDANGEVHYGDFPARPDAERVMTQGQIQQEENAEKAARRNKPPQGPTEDNKKILDEIQHRHTECRRYQNLKADMLMNSATQIPFRYNRRGYGYWYGGQNSNIDLLRLSQIEANIRKYCLE